MRQEVLDFFAFGGLPRENASQEVIARAETLLHSIEAPVSDEEARKLLECFGEDESFGLAWTLLHLIETSPVPQPEGRPHEEANGWVKLIYERAGQP